MILVTKHRYMGSTRSVKELKDFALKLGIKKAMNLYVPKSQAARNGLTVAHYDLESTTRRDQALQQGAALVTNAELNKACKSR